MSQFAGVKAGDTVQVDMTNSKVLILTPDGQRINPAPGPAKVLHVGWWGVMAVLFTGETANLIDLTVNR